MEFLAPPYRAVLHIRQCLQSGQSTRDAIQEYLRQPADDFSIPLHQWFLLAIRDGDTRQVLSSWRSPLRRAVATTLAKGLSGQPILDRLEELEEEMSELMRDAIERHIQTLPVFMLLPLLGLIFPSLLIVLVGPILIDLVARLS